MSCYPMIRATFIAALFVPAPFVDALTVEFAERSLTVREITPGAKVALFGVARESRNTRPRIPKVIVRAEILSDADGNGIVEWTLPTAVPRIGMWAVVDLSSGAHAAFATPRYESVQIALVPEILKNDNAGQLRKLEWPFGELDLLLVRPGEGAWRYYAAKDSAVDENRNNGSSTLKMDVGNMIRIGDSPAGPEKFRKGDIVVVFDRSQMRYGILEVGK